MSKQVSTFEGGIISDIDVSKVKPNQLVFPTVGIRVFNKDGKGLIATLLPGNEEYFDLSEGFMMMGGVEYEGIGFIFSLNVETGEGEVGTYPSPNLSSTGFKNVYTPLQNFQGVTHDLRTTLFNFNIHHQLDIKAKKSYDNSIDLYFIDHYNPDRIINCGFKLDGTTNKRYILPGNFDGALNHIPFTNKELKVNYADVLPGGYFKPGNVFVYIRYLTADYAATNFIKEIGPLSMAPGDTQLTHEGLLEKDFSTDVNSQTDRKITLNLTNIDTNFAYIQVGIVRYSATTENGPAQQDVWLIANYYPIISSSTIFAIYGDEEQESLAYADIIKTPFLYPISKSQTQIENRLLRANVKRSSLGYNRDALIHFASVIQVDEFYYDGDFATKTVQDYVQNGGLYSYQNANNVYKYLGYFKEQIYPFTCIYKFTDGTLSEAFPVLGNLGQSPEKGLYQFKTWQEACGVTPNQNRITGVSFDAEEAHNYYRNNEGFFKDVVGFYFARADRIDNLICQGVMMRGYYGVSIVAHYGSDPDPNWRICSFQGELASDPVHSGANTTKENNAEASIMPLFRGYMPTTHEDSGTKFYYGFADDNNSGGTNCLEYHESGYDGCYDDTDKLLTLPPRFYFDANHWSQFEASVNPWDNKHGLFSPDLLFDNGAIQINDNSYVRPLFTFGSRFVDGNGYATFGLQPYIIPSTRLIKPADIGIDLNQSNGMGYMVFEDDPSQFLKVSSARVSHLQSKGKLNFAGYFSSDGAENGFDWQSTLWNRDIGTCGYVGIEDTSIYKTLQKLYTRFVQGQQPDPYAPCEEHISIVNLYKNEITSDWQKGINDAFNVSSVQYSPISEMIAFGDLESQTTFNLFHGDCFLQKVWFRTHRWYAMTHNNDSGVDTLGEKSAFGMAYIDPCRNMYQHGFMVGMTVECRYNAGMRSESIGANTDNKYLKYTFFPKALQSGIDLEQWIVTEPGNYLQEATEINAGYDKVLSDNTIKGYDFTQPAFEYNKPNRVYASDAHVPGAFLDGYRSIQQNSYQDFATEDGDIMYIGKNLTFPFIVQRYGTNQIFINEKAIGQTDQGQDVIMGTSLTFFDNRVRKIGFMGTQHKSSVVEGTKGTYGFDYYNNIWWLINTAQLQTGLQQLKMEDLSGQLLITDELEKMFNIFSPDKIKSDELPDDPLSGLGIIGFADFDHEEVGMTFLLPITVSNNQWKPGGRASRTFVFNEKIEKFYGDYPFADHIYFQIGNLLLSNHSYLDDAYNYVTGNKMYLYNVKSLPSGQSNYATYFGNLADTQISFIVNGASDKENTSELVKIFNSLEVEMKDVKPKYIVFTTLYQSGTYDFSTTDFWQVSEYLEHKWHVPIILQTSVQEDAFKPDSEFRGAWLKVTLVFNTNEDIELKSVITDFDLSIA